MDTYVFMAVLAAAACHAGWNSLLKLQLEPIIVIALISVVCGLVALPLLPLAGYPKPACWPFIAASLALHMVYYIALAEAYRHGDLGQVYPIARGTAPLLTAAASIALSMERLSATAWAGISILTCGILILSVLGGRRGLNSVNTRSVGFALMTAAAISAYTLVDGFGARLSGSPAPYIVWLFLLDGVMMLVFGLWHRGAALIEGFRTSWRLALVGGSLAMASYAIAIWAMTVAPIALVAALRETSVLFASLISVVWLREPVRPARVVAVILAFTGVLMMRLE